MATLTDPITQNVPSSILIGKVADWLMDQALNDNMLEDVVRGTCERLQAAGLPLARGQFSFSMLHPLYAAMGYTWHRGQGLEIEGYRHQTETEPDEFKKSPYYHLLTHDLDHLRCRLDDKSVGTQFPIFEKMREQGLTDYLAFASSFRPGSGQGMLGSWATDRATGFNDGDIAALLRVQNRLAVTCKLALRQKLGRAILSTYLGQGAGERVLDGQIKRGDGDTVRAAIVMVDMRGSSRLAEKLGRQHYIDTLNTFFDSTASAYAEAGGEILSFLGDGFLAAFPCGRNRADSAIACKQALDATEEALERMVKTNEARTGKKVEPLNFGIGLHIGNVTFGNVGLVDRLTFSVFGSTVNEASRLESLTKAHKTNVIASERFIDYCGETCWQKIGKETLQGIDEPMTIFRLKDKRERARVIEFTERTQVKPRSSGDYVVLLHRDEATEP